MTIWSSEMIQLCFSMKSFTACFAGRLHQFVDLQRRRRFLSPRNGPPNPAPGFAGAALEGFSSTDQKSERHTYRTVSTLYLDSWEFTKSSVIPPESESGIKSL